MQMDFQVSETVKLVYSSVKLYGVLIDYRSLRGTDLRMHGCTSGRTCFLWKMTFHFPQDLDSSPNLP